MKREPPGFSMAIDERTSNIIIQIDEGKFMDSQYVYTEINPTPSGVVQYKTTARRMIVNGILRDEVEIENQFPELIDEFKLNVTSPVLEELISMLGHDDAPEPPKIILA